MREFTVQSLADGVETMTTNGTKMVQPSREKNSYSIVRIDPATSSSTTAQQWVVYLKRHRKLFVRHFSDSTYGGEEPALAMAMAYREALQRLFPPLTLLEHRTKPRSNNKSGIPGVVATYRKGKLTAWVAISMSDGQTDQKSFSAKVHGEDGAKALAIAARMEWLAQQSNRFVTLNAQATQAAESRFPQLLDAKSDQGQVTFPTAAPPDMDTVNRQLEQLNTWFDALLPQFFHFRVRIHPRPSRHYDSFQLVVGNKSVVDRLVSKSWTIQRRSYQDVLHLAWAYTQKIAKEQIGPAGWEQFQKKYRSSVFASTGEQPILIVHQLDQPQIAALRSQPPPALMPMLEGIHIPELPLTPATAAAS
ncbi:hypothetical protein GCM10027276_07920 [Comamonas piscis]